ncbi:hypothetical protein C9F11_43715 (plasmid) [Streptomyces sp. YIM 121038]|uniref:hypothetical protein n=1 Tax=Streptomyces sp. YIM 121038 TaxID=2136401 RepID=UPI001110E17A|nr:hypothetical protein [Streptomyces sp. YIM 121038]QCX82321.1 hypothetical protein C9F11_43715 [Streptomyces sp. YIM 121038]
MPDAEQTLSVMPPESGAVSLRTTFDFELPRGYVDDSGVVHKDGTMRLATGQDELMPLIDQRVRENPAYLGVVLLSLVVTRLGSVPRIDAELIGRLFAADLAYLQEVYRSVNGLGQAETAACPGCGTRFALPAAGSGLGES